MDESTQQAISIAVNITIFIIALTIGVNLLIQVRDISEIADNYNASLPNGSRVIVPDNQTKRIVPGYELLSYYSNYMTDKNNMEVYGSGYGESEEGKTKIVIESSEGNIEGLNVISDTKPIKEFFAEKVNLNSYYEIIVKNYDREKEFLQIIFKEI